MQRPLRDVVWISFDTETTGLSRSLDRVVEIAAVKFDFSGRVLESFESLVQPGISIPLAVSFIHGITDYDVRDAPSMREVLPRFLAFLGSVDNVLLAHNASFDAGFLGFEMERCAIMRAEHVILDTLSLSRRVLGKQESHSLDSLARFFSLDAGGHHRALADSFLVKEIFLRLLAAARAEDLDTIFGSLPEYRFTWGSCTTAGTVSGFEHLSRALESGAPLTIVYRGGSKGRAPRMITPLGYVEEGGRQYLRAYCHLDCVEKSFRLDRIAEFSSAVNAETGGEAIEGIMSWD
jgi:DNA polymerase III epsilon subunit family exonuclease